MIQIAALASGSNGNCYYIENENDAVLVDAGVSCKQIILRMENLGLDINKVKALFITHEHSDHVRGMTVLSKKYGIPVYISKKTFNNCRYDVQKEYLNHFSLKKDIQIGNFCVIPFKKNHDAAEPCSFTLESEGKKISVITDVGIECENVIEHLKEADALFLESNYDEDMLFKGGYPYFLKQRITSEFGHLSNNQAGGLILEHATPKLKYVFLSHLSGNNNDPTLAYETFCSLVKDREDLNISTILTSRETHSELIRL